MTAYPAREARLRIQAVARVADAIARGQWPIDLTLLVALAELLRTAQEWAILAWAAPNGT